MSELTHEEQASVIQRYVDQVLNGGAIEVARQLLAPDFSGEADDSMLGLGDIGGSPESVIAAHTQLHKIAPDAHWYVSDFRSDGDTLHLTYVLEGTHTGEPLLGIPATHKRLVIRGEGWVRFSAGRISAGGSEWDQAALVAQLTGSAQESAGS
jgi:predicted ester cyclase